LEKIENSRGFERNGGKDSTDLSQQSGVPRSTCHKIIKNTLQLHPYKISVVQELQPADYQSCV
jgi:hypothetical protein